VDVKHADHLRAIDTMPNHSGLVFLRWALIQQAKLGPEDSDRLFHNKTDGIEGICAAAARGDKERFRALYPQVKLPSTAQVVITEEYFKTGRTKPPKDQPDLMPPGARSISDLVRAEMARSRK